MISFKRLKSRTEKLWVYMLDCDMTRAFKRGNSMNKLMKSGYHYFKSLPFSL